MDLERRLFHTMITSECPMVFKHAVDDWQSLQWTPEYLCNCLEDQLLDCKISIIQHEEFQWEPDCLHLKIRMRHYVEWLVGEADLNNPLRLFDKTKYSCYIDYKYMKDMFKDQPHLLESISWDMFGLTEHGGEESTIWIGSCGTYTPCHQDTYGFNLVAQIQGRKRWYLFNPNQTDCMYPTRIPYEESSIYSEVNVRYPDLKRHSMFQKTTPYVIELVPGDVLYVPRHWWHFVECLEPSISINTWVPVIEDVESQLEESVTRLLYTCLSTTLLSETERKTYLNTGEELQSNDVNFHYLQNTVKTYLSQSFHERDLNTVELSSAETKQDKLTTENRHLSENSSNNWRKFCDKFQDYTVNVVCLCGIDIHENKQHTKTFHRKRKNPTEYENTKVKEEKTFDQNEIRIKQRKTELGKDVVSRESEKKSNDAEDIHDEIETSNVSDQLMSSRQGPKSDIKHGIEKDATLLSKLKDDSLCSQYSLSKLKTNKSVIEIYAAKSLTFNEYLKFLRIVFDFELESEDNCENNVLNSTKEAVDKNIKVCDSENMHSNIKREPTIDRNNYHSDSRDTNTGDINPIFDEDKDINISTADVINSVLDPGVVKHIWQVLLSKIRR